MNQSSDLQLLRDYSERQSDVAFSELVHRHIDLVHSAALRIVRDQALAKDVTQSVFVALAKNSAQLVKTPALEGWLHGTTRNLAANVVRAEVRRRNREQEAALMNEMLATDTEVNWEHIAPHLDEALTDLSPTERDALLLRYFKGLDFHSVGAQLGISDDAAQKRVSRAVERLREFFVKRGVTVGAGGLVVVISANAVQAAPAGLAVTISAAAFAGTAATTSTLIATTKTIAMTTLQKTLVTATVAVLAGVGIYETRQAARLREQNQALQQQQTPLAEQIQQLQNNFAEATNRLADLIAENARLKSNPHETELLKLRGEVTLLSNAAAKAAKDAANKARNPMADISSNPLLLENMRAQTSRMVKRDFAKLFSDLNLPQDKADALKDLITKKHNANNDFTAKLIAGNPDQSEIDKMGSETADKKKAVDEEIKQLLGADDYSKYQNYEDSLEQRGEISGPQGFAQSLPAGQKLTSDQTEQLISAMAEVKQNFNFSSGAKPMGSTLGITVVAMEKPASEINVDAFTAEMQQLDDRYLARAKSILTPDQYTAFQVYLADQIKNFQMGIMMTPKTSPSGGASR